MPLLPVLSRLLLPLVMPLPAAEVRCSPDAVLGRALSTRLAGPAYDGLLRSVGRMGLSPAMCPQVLHQPPSSDAELMSLSASKGFTLASWPAGAAAATGHKPAIAAASRWAVTPPCSYCTCSCSALDASCWLQGQPQAVKRNGLQRYVTSHPAVMLS
jgi:hypothetical protein